MSSQATLITIWLILALFAVNLPWVTDRRWLFFAAGEVPKPAWQRLLEWVLLSAVIMVIGAGFERKAVGGAHAQEWEFYAVLVCLLLVAAMPGFIYQYQVKKLFKKRR